MIQCSLEEILIAFIRLLKSFFTCSDILSVSLGTEKASTQED